MSQFLKTKQLLLVINLRKILLNTLSLNKYTIAGTTEALKKKLKLEIVNFYTL